MIDEPNEDNIVRKNVIKIILLGNTETGKTSLITAYDGKPFSEASLSTIGAQFLKKEIIINKKKYNLQIWDTAGQEKYRSVNKIYIKGSRIVLFVYDVTNESSFLDLQTFWVDYIDKILGKGITLGIVGNKIDLLEEVEVSTEKGRNFADEIGAFFIETSAKEFPKGIVDFINELVEDYVSKNANELEEEDNSFNINRKTLKKTKKNENNNDCCKN